MRYSFFKKSLSLFLCCFLVVPVVFISDAYAIREDIRSPISYNSSANRCDTGTIAFDPFGSNPDINWELSNPACAGLVAGTGAILLIAESASSYACLQPQLAAEAAASMATGVPLSPAMIRRRAVEATQCSALLSAQNYAQAAACCGGMTASLAATGVVVGVVAGFYDIAKQTYEKANICGKEWQTWNSSVDPDTNRTKWVKDKGPYQKCILQLFQNDGVLDSYCSSTPYFISSNAGSTALTVQNKYYREFIYGGMEFEDNGPNACDLPASWDPDKRKRILGYDSGKQKYYMTGPGAAPVFACYRFLTVDRNDQGAQIAYDCCKRRSQNVVCAQNQVNPYSKAYTFCEIGSKCTITPVTFEAYASRKQSNYACVKTYSLCPYNHLLGGGTEERAMDANDTTQVVNFCQFMNHCSKLPILPYIRTSGLDGGFISSACRDMKGDSQNVYGYTSQLIPVNTRGFSAPMVQCFKETMENIFLNKAGDTVCLNPDEYPSEDDTCTSGYLYRKGYDLPTKSFFIKIQDNVQSIIKMALSMSVLFFGAKILLGATNIGDKKVLLMYILKIGLVMYFAVGDGWQFGFMRGVLYTSGFLADLTFKVDESAPDSKKDGCQFPRYNYADTNDSTKYDNPAYPTDKEYLRAWDTLDCKIARALGFGPEVSVPNLALMIVGGFFTGGMGIVFFVGAFIFAFFLISMTVRAIHIFLISITAVVILMYVSPITITLSMFEKSKGIFDGWLKQLLGFTLQPMILFAYIGILVTLFDKMVIGDDVTFSPSTTVINGTNVTDTYGRIVPKKINCTGSANDTSIYCIFRVADIHTYTGFEVLGIGIPILTSMNQAKLQTIIKVGLIMFIFTKFMDKITSFAASLVGGAEISSAGIGMAAMAKKAQNALKGIQKRGMGALKKHGGALAQRAGGMAKTAANKIGNEGKSVGSKEATGGQSTIGGGQGANTAGGGTPRPGIVAGAGGGSVAKPPAASPPKKP